jgi:hypothetical protein
LNNAALRSSEPTRTSKDRSEPGRL